MHTEALFALSSKPFVSDLHGESVTPGFIR
jgi:hypothetical protein